MMDQEEPAGRCDVVVGGEQKTPCLPAGEHSIHQELSFASMWKTFTIILGADLSGVLGMRGEGCLTPPSPNNILGSIAVGQGFLHCFSFH